MKGKILFTWLLLVCLIQLTQAATFTSVTSGNWNDGATWGNASPGSSGTDWPAAGDNAVIAATHTVSLTGDRTITNITIQTGGILTGGVNKLTVNNDLTVQGTGYFTIGDDLTVNGNASIGGSGSSTSSDIMTFNGNLSVLNTATLTCTAAQDLKIIGDLVVDGTLLHNNADKKIKMDDGGASNISGTGIISSTELTAQKIKWKSGTLTVLAGSSLTINCKVGVEDVVITNNGSIEFNYDVDHTGGMGGAATWTQGTNSTLKIGATIFASSGTLNASASGNTVEFDKAGAQTIFQASSNQYWNLTLSGSGTKSTAVDFDVDGTFTTSGTANFDPGGDDITLAGNLVNNGTMTAGTGASRFLFNGTTTISGSNAPNFHDFLVTGTVTGHATNMNVDGRWSNSAGTFTHNSGTVTQNGTTSTTFNNAGGGNFYNLTINNTAATSAITLTSAIGVDGTLTFTDGHIVTSASNLLTFGAGGAASGADDDSHIVGPAAKNTNSTSNFTFPIGTGTTYRSIGITPTSTGATTYYAKYYYTEQTEGTGVSGLDHISTIEYWEMDRTSGSANAAVVLSWDALSFVDNLTDLCVGQWNASNWISNGNASTTGNTAAGTITSNTLSSFSTKYFTLASTTTNNFLEDRRYSVATGNWNATSTWALTSGGAPGAAVPTTTTSVYIEGSDVVTLVAAVTVKKIDIEAGSSLALGANKPTITSTLVLDGTITGTADVDLTGKNLSGTGSTTLTGQKFNFVGDSALVAATASLTFNNDVKIATNDIDITNSGTVTIVGALLVNNTGNMWINGTNATLAVTGAVLAANQLTASAPGNTIKYNGSGAQTVISPLGTQYENLELLTSGAKTLGGAIDVDGNLTIGGTASLNPSTYNATLEGNLVNNGTLTQGTGASTFIFDGSTAISGTGTPKFHHVTITGGLTAHATTAMEVNGNWADNGTFTHSSQTLSFTGTTAISGSATTNFNNLTITGTVTGSTGCSNVAGNWVNNGTFTHNSGTICFNGTSTISGSSSTSFGGVTITGALTAPASANLNVARDWNNSGGTFTHNSGTLVLNGSSTQTFSNTGSGNYNNITINNSKGGFAITQNGPATVLGAFTLTDGHVTSSGSNYFTINTGGTFSGATDSSHVKGPFAVQSNSTSAITFPVGGYGKYRYIKVTPTSSSATTYVGAYFRAEHGLGTTMETGMDHISNWEYWEVDRVSGTADATLVLTWNAASIVDNLSQLRVAHYDGAEWDSNGNASTTGNTTAGTITSSTVTSFSSKYFTLGSTTSNNPLSNFKFSVATGNWNATSTWSYRTGGAAGAPVPSGENWVFIEGGYTVTLNAAGSITKDMVIKNGSRLNGGGSTMTISGDLTTEGTGYFSLDNELDVSGTVTIGAGGASTQSHKCDFHGDLIIEAGASLTQTTSGNQDMNLEGDIVVDGTLALNDNDKKIKWQASGAATLSGTGTISSSDLTSSRFEWQASNRTILASTNLTINCLVTMGENITNNGSIEFNYSVDEVGGMGGPPAPVWTQGDSSTVKFGGTVFATAGSLIASATGNTVEFDKAGAQTVFDANSNQFWHLTLSSSGTKTLADHIDVDGDLSISGTASLALNSKDITLAGNWVNSSGAADAFVQGTQTVTLNGAADQTITNSSDETFYNLTVNKSGGEIDLAAGTDIIISNALTLTQGLIDASTNSCVVKFLDNATTNGGDADSYVVGQVQKTGNDAFAFPIGDGAKWARLHMTAPDDVADAFTAQYILARHSDGSVSGINNVSEFEYWDLSEDTDAGSATSIFVTLYWQNSSFSKISQFDSDLRVAHYNGTDWEDAGHSGISGGNPSGTVTSAAVSSFSPFTFGSSSGNNVLPLELISFNAKLFKNVIQVTWETASEQGFGHFEVEESTDGEVFNLLERVEAVGNSNELTSYTATDFNPEIGVNYYRLRMVELDGTHEYSQVEAVVVTRQNEIVDVKLYPNPFQGTSLQLDLKGYLGESVFVELYNFLGSRLYSEELLLEYGTTNLVVELQNPLATGSYFVVVSSATMRESKILLAK